MPFFQSKICLKTLCLLSALTSLTVGADEIMLDNFELNPEQRWRYVSDQVMGGISNGQVVYRKEGDVSYAHMTGIVSTENNGGFIQLRTGVVKGVAEKSAGVILRVRGEPQKYYVHLRTRGTVLPWQFYQASFDIDKQWQTIKVPFSAFKGSSKWLKSAVNSGSIRSIGVVAFGRDHIADVQIAAIGFYD